MPPTLSIEDYDTILDALDTEDTNTILKYFQILIDQVNIHTYTYHYH